ncbi:MAG TPA: hypothetical protein PKW90_00565 [Myxococcota bacterium]|nr:hypothetical protein [Myxococcota bacterium]
MFYHGGTGSTHRLSEVAGVVWEMINDRQGDEAVLLRWLLDEGDDDAEVTLAAVLGQLARLELIEPDHAVG